MYAVVETGGKQYRVQVGQRLNVERLPGEVGAEVVLDQVLLVGEGDQVRVGQPKLAGARVVGRILEQGKAKKILVFKHKRRKSNRLTKGHRQRLTTLRIEGIVEDSQA